MRNEIILIAFGVVVLPVTAMYIYLLYKVYKSETSQTDDDSSNGDKRLVEKDIIEPPKQVATQDSPKASSTSIEDKPNQISTASLEEKLDKLYDVMNHIRWIGLSIAGMFAITFIIPHLIN